MYEAADEVWRLAELVLGFACHSSLSPMDQAFPVRPNAGGGILFFIEALIWKRGLSETGLYMNPDASHFGGRSVLVNR